MRSPIRKLREWLEWRRRDRQRIFVGSWEAETEWMRGGEKTGVVDRHIVSFYVDGNGVRWSEVETTNEDAADTHKGVLSVRHNWRRHGIRPGSPDRAAPSRPGPLRVIRGGKPGVAE